MSKKTYHSVEFLKDLHEKKTEMMEHIVHSYTLPLLKGALSLGLSRDQAEDLAQQVWEAFFSKVENFQGRSHIRTYLFGILYNKSKELFRETKKSLNNDPIDDIVESRFSPEGQWGAPPIDPEKFALTAESMTHVEQCLQNLSLNQRMAFCLKEIDHESNESICKILEVTSTNLGVLLYRARNYLRECIEKKSNL